MNNIRHLPRLMVFAVVAQKGSFTQAAQSLGVTKSAVSQQITQLETDLGVRLLNRTTRGVALTALGEKLLLRCQLLQDQVGQMFVDISDAGVEPHGRFAVTFPHSLETEVVIPALEQLCLEYPRLEPELVTSDGTLDLVAHHLDAAIHVGELSDSSYRALPVGTMMELFCATPLYLSRSHIAPTLHGLSEHRWIAANWQRPDMTVWHPGASPTSQIRLNRFAQVNTLPSAVAMALRHMGMVLLPDAVAKPLLKTGELVPVAEGVRGRSWPVNTVHAYANGKPLHLSRFHQLVCRFFVGVYG